MLSTGFVGLVYIVLQNALLLENTKWKWLKFLVRIVDSRAGHISALAFASFNWVAVIVTTAVAWILAHNRGDKISIDVDGSYLDAATIQ